MHRSTRDLPPLLVCPPDVHPIQQAIWRRYSSIRTLRKQMSISAFKLRYGMLPCGLVARCPLTRPVQPSYNRVRLLLLRQRRTPRHFHRLVHEPTWDSFGVLFITARRPAAPSSGRHKRASRSQYVRKPLPAVGGVMASPRILLCEEGTGWPLVLSLGVYNLFLHLSHTSIDRLLRMVLLSRS